MKGCPMEYLKHIAAIVGILAMRWAAVGGSISEVVKTRNLLNKWTKCLHQKDQITTETPWMQCCHPMNNLNIDLFSRSPSKVGGKPPESEVWCSGWDLKSL